jgi:uroporphyrinogen decarboxylase
MSKELIFQTMRHEQTDRVPWVPFAGVHAGKLKGHTAKEVLTDKEKLVESLLEVNRLYTPDGMPVVFDLQIEAEILGCELLWSEENPPSVAGHPLASHKGIPGDDRIPTKRDGRIPLILEAMGEVKAAVGDNTALYGLICGPFTLASHLRGSEIFMDMVTDKEYVRELTAFCTKVCFAMTNYYVEAGMDVIAVVDPLVSQVSPAFFTDMLAPSFTNVFDHIRNAGVYSSFFVCGNATRQIDVMCRTKPDSISVDENVDIRKAKEVTDEHNIAIGGNIPLTTTMLFGNQQDNMKYVIDLLDSMDHHNYIVAPGCDMPYDVPIENVIAATQAVRQTDEVRAMVENYESAGLEAIEVTLPDYSRLERPLIEVFTLDSATCAACTYMMNSALVVGQHFGDAVDVVEYKYTRKEDIARMQKMGIANLPCMFINGELKWSSIIPSRQELFDAVEAVR